MQVNPCDFRASTANEKLKHEAQTQDGNDMQVMSVLNMKLSEAVSQHYHVPPAHHASAEALTCDIKHARAEPI